MTWPAPNPDEWVYLLKPAALVENVECQTCGGTRYVQPNRWTDQVIPCPDCNWNGTGRAASTPENVECQGWTCSCGQTFTHGLGTHLCADNGHRLVRRIKPIEVEFGPENGDSLNQSTNQQGEQQ